MTNQAYLLEGINPSAHQLLEEAKFTVHTFEKSSSQAELAELATRATALGVRSGPALERSVIEAGANHSLEAIGCFCAGTNHVDSEYAAEYGIPVFNAAGENTTAVAEHVIGSVFALLRRTAEHNESMHDGYWTKTDERSYEVNGKTLGVVGYGAIGREVARLAKAVGMKVSYYDMFPAAQDEIAEYVPRLDLLLHASDVVTLHVPGGDKTHNLIDKNAIGAMKQGAFLINAARGDVVDYYEVAMALENGKLGGVAADVFAEEPSKRGDDFSHILQMYPNAILTPHIAGSTVEAQYQIGKTVAGRLANFVRLGSTVGAVNLPELALDTIKGDARITSVHHNVPTVMAHINDVIADVGHNVVRQSLETNGPLGYLALDVEGQVSGDLVESLDQVEDTLQNRILRP